jgi:hypothetical protein
VVVGSTNIHFNSYGIINIDPTGFFDFNTPISNVSLTNFIGGVINKNNNFNVAIEQYSVSF